MSLNKGSVKPNGVSSDLDPTQMSDEQATKLGLKQYLVDEAYGGRGAITLAAVAVIATITNVRSVLIPYQTQDGSWRMKMNLVVNTTETGGNNNYYVFSMSGIIFKNVTSYKQSLSGGVMSAKGYQGHTGVGTDEIIVNIASGAIDLNGSEWKISGDVELESKPTWAY